MDLAARGDIRAVIDRRYPLAEIAAAHAYVDTGRKRGSVVITVGEDAGNAGAVRPVAAA
jgi:NADPH:quinone reductase-like Zn-dependent oxidoreductase